MNSDEEALAVWTPPPSPPPPKAPKWKTPANKPLPQPPDGQRAKLMSNKLRSEPRGIKLGYLKARVKTLNIIVYVFFFEAQTTILLGILRKMQKNGFVFIHTKGFGPAYFKLLHSN